MVKSWAPEPPENRDDHLPVLSSEHIIFPQSEDSDDMVDQPDPPSGYTLFANTNVEDHSNEESDDDDNDTELRHSPSPENPEAILQNVADTHSQTLLGRNSDALEVSRLFSMPNPSDIVIDCEQVRAAMATVTLPPSAFPPWAVGISDTEIADQIQRLLNKTGGPSSDPNQQ